MKRNPLFSFTPGFLTGRQQRARYGRQPYNRRVAGMVRRARGSGQVAGRGVDRSDLVSALVNLGYAPAVAKRTAARAKGSDFNEQLRDALKGLKKNPRRQFPAVAPKAAEALRKLSRLSMRKTRKKKRNSRKGKMPAGLKAYWAKKRAKKNAARRRRRPRKTVRRRRMRVNPRPRRRVVRRRRAVVRRKMPKTMRPPFPMTMSQLKKYARSLARATGKSVRIKRP